MNCWDWSATMDGAEQLSVATGEPSVENTISKSATRSSSEALVIVPFTSGVVTSSRPAERLMPLSSHPSSTSKPFQVKALPTSTSTGSLLVLASSLLQAPRAPRQASATRPVRSEERRVGDGGAGGEWA